MPCRPKRKREAEIAVIAAEGDDDEEGIAAGNKLDTETQVNRVQSSTYAYHTSCIKTTYEK